MSSDLIGVEEPKNPKYAVGISWGWVIICLGFMVFIIVKKGLNSISLSDLGGYVSGVFAPVALYWFYLSFRVQAKELQLQREELKNSVEAQQGSEIALAEQALTLKEQSKALTEQLKITAKQFEYYLREIESKKPLYTLSGFSDEDEPSVHLYPDKTTGYSFFFCAFNIKNINAGAEITKVEMYYIDETQNPIRLKSEFKTQSNKITLIEAYSNLRIDSFQYAKDNYNFEGSQMSSHLSSHYEREIALNYLKSCKLRIYYRLTQETGSGNDEYIIKHENNNFSLHKLTERSVSYNIQWEHENSDNPS